MSNVVISNRSIFNQRVSNIEQNKVLLPFNISKEQTKKLVELLSKIKVTFLSEQDKLNISNLTYNNINVKANDRQFINSRFTLSKTYVVTMKQSFITKVSSFYGRLVEYKAPERPVFNIGNETNLQAALAEATTEIDLSAINASLNYQNIQPNTFEQPNPQVLANNPLGETVIANPVNLNPQPVEMNPVNQMPFVQQQIQAQPQFQQQFQTQPQFQQQPQIQPLPQVNNPNMMVQPAMTMAPNINMQEVVTPVPELAEKPKKRVKKLKGNVLAVPIVVIWLGAVFYGTLKLVTSILT